MVLLTSVWIASLTWYTINLGSLQGLELYPKKPIDYNIGKAYVAEELETQPDYWYTPENLGITLTQDNYTNHYDIWIVNEIEALSWTKYEEFVPNALKYEDRYYRIVDLEIFLGFKQEQPWKELIWGAIGVGWLLAGILYVKERK